jgi:hypothetical protein
MTTEKSTVQLGVLYSVCQELPQEDYQKITEIIGDENPGGRRQNMTEEYRRIRKRILEASARYKQQ